MKTIEFKKYVREENSLESYGTVKDLAGKGGTIGLIPKNVADASKRLVIIVGKKDGTSTPFSCSPAVSKAVRAKDITIGQLAGLEVLEVVFKNGDIGPMVCMPAGTGSAVKTISIDKLKTEEVKAAVSTEIDMDELVAF